jgi:hypothetical protein
MGVARTIGPLERKYLEIEQELDALRRRGFGKSPEGRTLVHVLECLRVSIRLFDVAWKPPRARQARSEITEFGLRRGELGGTAVRIIGEAEAPMTTREVAVAIMQRIDMPGDRWVQTERMTSTLSNLLRQMEKRGYLKAEDSPVRWSVTQANPLESGLNDPVKPRPRTPRHVRRRRPG